MWQSGEHTKLWDSAVVYMCESGEHTKLWDWTVMYMCESGEHIKLWDWTVMFMWESGEHIKLWDWTVMYMCDCEVSNFTAISTIFQIFWFCKCSDEWYFVGFFCFNLTLHFFFHYLFFFLEDKHLDIFSDIEKNRLPSPFVI